MELEVADPALVPEDAEDDRSAHADLVEAGREFYFPGNPDVMYAVVDVNYDAEPPTLRYCLAWRDMRPNKLREEHILGPIPIEDVRGMIFDVTI